MAALPDRIVPAPLARWWATKSTRERRVVLAIAVLALAAGAWFAAWQPLQRDLAALRAAAPANRAALAEARRVAAEIAGLARSPAPPPVAATAATVQRILAERGLGGGGTQVDWNEGRVRITLPAARFDGLVGALEALQRDAALHVVEATLTARVDPGTVRAEIVLTQ